MRKSTKYISASEIGAVSFCDTAYYNQLQGVKSSKRNQANITRGNLAHEALSQQAIKEQSSSSWFMRLIKWLFGWIAR